MSWSPRESLAEFFVIGWRVCRSRSLIILPTYNERANLEPLITAVLSQGVDFDALIIDDASPDGTGLVAEQCKAQHPGRVEVMNRQGKLGLATAYLSGFHYGLQRGYDYVFQMDADHSHNPEYLSQFLGVVQSTKADVVLGSRYMPGGGAVNWPWYRRLISRGGSWYAGSILGLEIRDLTGGFKCFRRHVLEAMDLDTITSTGYGFQIELTFRAVEAGFAVVEMPIIFEERRAGDSKMSPAIFIEAFWMVLKMRARRGTKVARSERS